MSTPRPTILQIIPELDTGGAELSAIEIVSAIVAGGGRALVLSEGGRLAPRVDAAGGRFIPFAAATKNPLHIWWNAREIAKLVDVEGVDLVHARSRAPGWSAWKATRKTGKPFVTTYHGAYSETNRLKKRYNSVMASGDLVIANSRYTADLIESRYGTPRNKIRVIYRGLDGGEFDPSSIATDRLQALRVRWQVHSTDRIILQTARLTSWKGQRIVIEAARLLQQKGLLGNAVVILAGDAQGRDVYRRSLESQIANAGLQNAVRLVGHVEDIPAALSLAHVAVIASTEPEAFGRAATEAQAMRCPVIATNIGAPPETVIAEPAFSSDQSTGWLVPPGDAACLADILAKALSLPERERTALGIRARRRVLENFSLAAMRRQTLDVYDTLLGTALARSQVAGAAATPE